MAQKYAQVLRSRGLPILRVTALGLSLAVCAAMRPGPAVAQQPVAHPDSVQRDSVPRDSVNVDTLPRGPHGPGMLLLIPIGVFGAVVMGLAPAAIALLEGPPGRGPLAILDRHRAAYVSVGGVFYDGETWAHSANLEVIQNGVLVELKVEDFYRPSHFQYLTARGGYLFHPNSGAAGGITIGYRHAHRDPTQAGLELGLPFFVGDSTATFRIEPTYVVSPHGVLWSYRAQWDFYVPRTPYFAGLTGVGKSVPLTPGHPRHDHPRKSFYVGAVTLMFGVRF